jgi:hypothetical protein
MSEYTELSSVASQNSSINLPACITTNLCSFPPNFISDFRCIIERIGSHPGTAADDQPQPLSIFLSFDSFAGDCDYSGGVVIGVCHRAAVEVVTEGKGRG